MFGTAMWDWSAGTLMWAANDATLMWIDDADLGVYTILDNGYVQFTTAPADGVEVKLNANFYFRCRFSDSSGNAGDTGGDVQFNEFMQNLWELKQCCLIGSLTNKI
jgi:hypothetical protein